MVDKTAPAKHFKSKLVMRPFVQVCLGLDFKIHCRCDSYEHIFCNAELYKTFRSYPS
jgi:hypothetical protein